MRDLAMHILDLMENSTRAEATSVRVTIEADRTKDLLRIVIQDNGRGLEVPAKQAADPFYTTKRGKKMGLGLSLFAASAERAGSGLKLRMSRLGGLAVEARMQLSHIDRTPLGDLAGTICTMVCAHPGLDLRLVVQMDQAKHTLNVQKLAARLGCENAVAMARAVEKYLKNLPLHELEAVST